MLVYQQDKTLEVVDLLHSEFITSTTASSVYISTTLTSTTSTTTISTLASTTSVFFGSAFDVVNESFSVASGSSVPLILGIGAGLLGVSGLGAALCLHCAKRSVGSQPDSEFVPIVGAARPEDLLPPPPPASALLPKAEAIAEIAEKSSIYLPSPIESIPTGESQSTYLPTPIESIPTPSESIQPLNPSRMTEVNLDNCPALQNITQSTEINLDDKETIRQVSQSTEVDLDDEECRTLWGLTSSGRDTDLDEIMHAHIGRLTAVGRDTDLDDVVLTFEATEMSVLWERQNLEPVERQTAFSGEFENYDFEQGEFQDLEAAEHHCFEGEELHDLERRDHPNKFRL